MQRGKEDGGVRVGLFLSSMHGADGERGAWIAADGGYTMMQSTPRHHRTPVDALRVYIGLPMCILSSLSLLSPLCVVVWSLFVACCCVSRPTVSSILFRRLWDGRREAERRRKRRQTEPTIQQQNNTNNTQTYTHTTKEGPN